MKFTSFIKEKFFYIVCVILAIILSTSILIALNPVGGIYVTIFIGVLYIIGVAAPFIIEFNQKKNFYDSLYRIFDSLDRKNLIAEIIRPPTFKEGIILYDILKSCNKAMLEEINKYKYIQQEYEDYIELWVHEIKTPIASTKLITQNNKNDVTDSVFEEVEKIENLVEQVLYYSRSNVVEKDYMIKEINLEKLCYKLIKKNQKFFIQNNIKLITENLNLNILSDVKWLEFIINQILVNSIKYLDKTDSYIKLMGKTLNNNIILIIEDNGIGIKAEELLRIFEKGFTGTNGRKNERSTGMGLYICKRLCEKLGYSITADSTVGEYTRVRISFPQNSMITNVTKV